MSLDLLENVFVYGNLDILYSSSKIKDLDLKNLLEQTKNIKTNMIKGWNWILYNNLTYILNCYENFIFSDYSKFEKFVFFISKILDHYEKLLDIKKITIDIKNLNETNVFIILMTLLINNIYDKLQTYKLQNKNINEVLFHNDFERYLVNIKNKSLFIDFVTPYDNIRWTSKLKVIFNNSEVYFDGIDVFLDSYTKNKNFYYNTHMSSDVSLLTERLIFLKIYSEKYYCIINNHLGKITEKIFEIFPYNILISDYRKLILCSEKVFRPPLLKNEDLSNLSDNYMMFSVIPTFLTSYILGFPVISVDIPSLQVIKKYLKKLDDTGEEKYFDHISNNFNKKKLDAVSFETESGNAKEGENYTDLCFNNLIEYNQDDIISLFNNNVIHHFSCKEFKTILNKKQNPYNRQDFNIFYHILENLKFKKKIKKIFSNRGLQLEINGTMEENFEELKENIKKDLYVPDEISTGDLDLLYQPIIDIIFSSERNF